MPRPARNLVGIRFGSLLVLEPAANQGKYRRWRCRCGCGVEFEARGGNIQNGNTKSCGCTRPLSLAKVNRSHGMANRSPEYFVWKGMRERCNTPSHISYQRYGGRGIRICERWDSFENFLADMGCRPSCEHSIERLDNDGNYEPINCVWATKAEQNNNRRSSRRITAFGRTQTLSQWGREARISPGTLHARLKQGWTIERALTAPVSKIYKRETLLPEAQRVTE